MDNSSAISVVVPMYKVEQYIKLCVDSILAQTFKDFEIIFVDYASPDRCAELCQKLYGGNDKVRLVRHEKKSRSRFGTQHRHQTFARKICLLRGQRRLHFAEHAGKIFRRRRKK